MGKPAKTKNNLKKCICMKCSSYTLGCKIKNISKNMIGMMSGISKKDHFEGLFCAFNKSNCIKEKKDVFAKLVRFIKKTILINFIFVLQLTENKFYFNTN